MTREEFIEVLNQGGHSYRKEGNKLVVTDYHGIDLGVTHIPPGVEFSNNSYVYLDSLEEIPSDIKFRNSGSVSLFSLGSIPRGVSFENGRGIFLDSLGVDSREWEGNIEGINPRKIINEMVSYGIFE